MRAAGAALLLAAASAAAGAEVERLDVRRDAPGVYRIELDARLRAAPAAVRAMILDPAHWPRVMPWLVELERLGAPRPGVRRMRTVLRGCVLFFCRDLRHVMDFRTPDPWTVEAHTVREGSDFRHGRTRWRILPEGAGTRLRMESELEPAFWVPPLIGPWVLRMKLRGMAEAVVRHMDGEDAGEDGEPEEELP